MANLHHPPQLGCHLPRRNPALARRLRHCTEDIFRRLQLGEWIVGRGCRLPQGAMSSVGFAAGRDLAVAESPLHLKNAVQTDFATYCNALHIIRQIGLLVGALLLKTNISTSLCASSTLHEIRFLRCLV